MMISTRLIISTIIVMLLGSPIASAQQVLPAGTEDTLITYVPWNPVRRPKMMGDALLDCAKDDICRTVVDAAGTYVGLPPGTISGALEALEQAGGLIKGGRVGEEYRTHVYAPRGYRICDVMVHPISAAPMNKRRSPTFAATVQSDRHFELYSFVHQQGVGGGRSWVDTVAVVQFVKIGSSYEKVCWVMTAVSSVAHQLRKLVGDLNSDEVAAEQRRAV